MPLSVFTPADRSRFIERINRLTPQSKGLWGRMTVLQGLDHMKRPMLAGLGRLPVTAEGPAFLRGPVGRYLTIYIFPWPKGKTPTAKEFNMVENNWPGPEFETGRKELLEILNEFGSLPASHQFPEHPAFGNMPYKQWGHLQGRHLNHHLSQFGV